MKTMVLAAAAALSLGMNAAFAQGLPPGSTPPVYGSQAFPNQSYHNNTVLSEIFGHSRGGQVNRTAEQNATSAKGG